MAEKVRLQKYLASCGVASRRHSETLILEGRVRVNGHPVRLGDSVDPAKDIVTLSGERVVPAQKTKRYYMLNKPRGYVTTMGDRHAQKCVADLLADLPGRIYPVGRLDKDSEGLLICTDDGELANALMHPSAHVPKTYVVTVTPRAAEEQLVALTRGVVLDGKRTQPASVRLSSEGEDRSVLQITIKEGRNRQIRRMCEAVGLSAKRLKRVSVGSLRLGHLAPGAYRELTKEELAALRRSVQAKPKTGGATRQNTR